MSVIAGIIGTAVPAAAHSAIPLGTVNIRSGPGETYQILTTLSTGQKATVLSHEGSWLKVKTSAGTVGYMADWVTREVYDDETAYAKVATDVLNVRTGPGTAYERIGQITQGQQFRALERLAGWYKIDAGSLGTGWVASEYVQLIIPTPTPAPPPPTPSTSPTTPIPAPPPPPAGDVTGVLPKAVTAAVSTSMLTGRDREYDWVASLRAGESLTYVDSAEGWVKVANAAGARGWVEGDRVRLRDQGTPFIYQPYYEVREADWAISYLKVREVTALGNGLQLRTGPSASDPVIRTLSAGQKLQLIAIPGGEYVKVLLESGEIGWVSRNYLKLSAGSFPSEGVHLSQPSPGVMRLEVAGSIGAVSAANGVLTLGLPELSTRRASLAVNLGGISQVTMDPSSLKLHFTQGFRHTVVEQGTGRTVIEIRPVVKRVEKISAVGREIYRFHVDGQTEPVLRQNGGEVMLDLPGARLESGVALPAGLTVQNTAAGLRASTITYKPYLIKRGAGYVDLVILAPGLAGKTIVVDPGHGGVETGAVGSAGLYEKEVNLNIALRLKAQLEAAGATVVMTRSADTRCATAEQLASVAYSEHLRYDLNCRTVVPNTAGADAFISIHSNGNPSRAENGTETYWSSSNLNAVRSHLLATEVQHEMVSALGTYNRGVRDNIFYVVTFTDAPAVLAEVAFVSNPTEEQLLLQDSFRQKTADSLFRSMQRFFQ